MTYQTVNRIQRWVLFLMILSLPLNNMPQRFAVPGFHQTALNYFAFLGILLLGYEFLKFGLKADKWAGKFFLAFFAWQIICLLHGLYIYSYEELMIIDEMPRVQWLVQFLAGFGIVEDRFTLIKVWWFFSGIKNILFRDDILFFVLFYVYHLYHDDFGTAFFDVRRAVVWLFVLLGIYSFIELLWLKLSLNWAKDILCIINPFLYDPAASHGWWPPLLWNNQLRSIFSEPSWFGIVGAFMLPFLWSFCFEKGHKYVKVFMICYFMIMLFATNARTAIVLVFIELGVLILFVIPCRVKGYIYSVLLVASLTGVAFGINLIDFHGIIENNKQNMAETSVVQFDRKEFAVDAKKYVQQNIESVGQKNSRSNNVRANYFLAGIKTIQQYPVWGVGYGLSDIYIEKNIPATELEHGELALWKEYMHKYGIFKCGYACTNKYIQLGMHYGLYGLIFYFLPLFYLWYRMFFYRKYLFYDYKLICLCIALIGLLGAFFSNISFATCSGIVWGLLYCKLAEIKANIENPAISSSSEN